MAVCGMYFMIEEPLPAIRVLWQTLGGLSGFSRNVIAVDAFKRDGNTLESFGGLIIIISWSLRERILDKFASHCWKAAARQEGHQHNRQIRYQWAAGECTRRHHQIVLL
ncbi:hypothetical protein GUITHDRAFT_111142 [Guillardia theta CCMP2712]|uniref:Uncharacterized protein n=1 Tax=Guillardia theta (strain CCMP2712) TaxID=905079 RepID=L1J3B1_GUITC|nr:hypothetical protein GUITHDRAFT_111142 [Guillardia theta CCMP2712]EKX42772.1 hypothetical protein GUITHDRAFT_111142 [Guillardia theta CCMP2712]|eukprot:XP_005829752.1 hypothetical protein GUITHDRAFT_111142 [Guillardia theta CCMP2712]